MLLVDVAFLLFVGCRGYVMTDWYLYRPLFDTVPTLFELLTFEKTVSFEGHFEPLFILYNCFFKGFTSSYEHFVFVNVVIDLCLLHVVFRRYLPKHCWAFFILIYLAFNGWTNEFDLIRNIKAILLFLLSLKYVERRQPIPYFVLNIIGLGFHWTAIVFLPLYFFFHIRLSRRSFILIALFSFIVIPFVPYFVIRIGDVMSMFGNDAMRERFVFYSNASEYNMAKGFGIEDLQRVLLFVMFCLFYTGFSKNEHAPILLNAFLCYLLLAAFGSGFEIVLKRVAPLFLYSIWIGVPLMAEIVSHRNKFVLYVLFILLSFGKTYKLTYWIPFFEYDNILIGEHKTYEERTVFFEANIDAYRQE